MKASILTLTAALLLVTAPALIAQDAAKTTPALMRASFGKLPIYFIENRGVYPDEVKYYIKGADKTLFFTKEGITFRLKGKEQAWVVKLEFVGANPNVQPRGEDRQQPVFSYFKGPEKDWRTGLRSFAKVVYEDLWPGIDPIYRGTVTMLKYEFVVNPGADPGKIRLRYRGATEVKISETDGLRVETPVGSFEDEPPVAWQVIDGVRMPVAMAFALSDETDQGVHSVGFSVGEYDPTRPLVLDPAVFVYCGYLGGSTMDSGSDVAVDSSGCAYITGVTWSSEVTFPVKVGPDLTSNGLVSSQGDAFVAKVSADGSQLIYCGYIGGSNADQGISIAVDSSGNAYVTGITTSSEQTFPVKIGPDLTYNGAGDAYVAKVDAKGTGLLYCGYLGGAQIETGWGVAVDQSGCAYVAGTTRSDQKTFPVVVGPDLTFNSILSVIDDAFVAKVDQRGATLLYCGYIGGAWGDYGRDVAVDAQGSAFVTGYVLSDETSFPVRTGPGLIYRGGTSYGDAFVARVSVSGASLVFCGYIGGTGNDSAHAIALDSFGNSYVAGGTDSTEASFPVVRGPDLTYNGGREDVFVAKVKASGTGLVYCGYIGGAGWEGNAIIRSGIAVDASGHAHVAGRTESSEHSFPVKWGPDLTYNGAGLASDLFVAKVYPTGAGLVYCGYIGGSGYDEGGCVAVDSTGNAYVVGCTRSDAKTFPVKIGPDLTYGGPGDAFVAKVALTLLEGTGNPRPGSSMSLFLAATMSAGLPYQLGSSWGTGPIHLGKRQLGLSPDDLLVVTVNNYWPWIFSGYRGKIDNQGQAKAAINIPNVAGLVGQRIHTAFVTLNAPSPSGIKSISNTYSFTITK